MFNEQELNKLSTEQLMALKEKLTAKKQQLATSGQQTVDISDIVGGIGGQPQAQPQTMGGRILSGLGRGLQAGLKALPYVVNNQIPPQEDDYTKKVKEALLIEQAKRSLPPTAEDQANLELKKSQADYYRGRVGLNTDDRLKLIEAKAQADKDLLDLRNSYDMNNPETLSAIQAKEAETKLLEAKLKQVESGVMGKGQTGRSAIIEKLKNQKTEDLYTLVEQNNISRDLIKNATESSKRIQGGLGGKIQRAYLRNIDPNNPILGDWQNVKMVLTDAQLLNTAKTKGAISDKEMELFANAAANDDIASLQAIMPVLNKLSRFIDASEQAAIKSYSKNYGEDPSTWEDLNINKSNSMNFNSEQEALAAGLPSGSIVIINGRKARID